MDVEKRLLKLADSFAEQTSREDLDAFTAQVLGRLGLPVPSKTVATDPEGPARSARVGPSGGGLREGAEPGRRHVGERNDEFVGR